LASSAARIMTKKHFKVFKSPSHLELNASIAGNQVSWLSFSCLLFALCTAPRRLPISAASGLRIPEAFLVLDVNVICLACHGLHCSSV
jgi:hypothetical protein